MSTGFLSGLVAISHSPLLIFLIGLLSSFAVCSLVLLMETSLFDGGVLLRSSSLRPFRYQRFRKELVTFPRHLGFASGDAYDLEDHELH